MTGEGRAPRERRAAFPPTRKSLGQHFLTDRRILGRIADALRLEGHETVLEIGPGRGALTDILAERAHQIVEERQRQIVRPDRVADGGQNQLVASRRGRLRTRRSAHGGIDNVERSPHIVRRVGMSRRSLGSRRNSPPHRNTAT